MEEYLNSDSQIWCFGRWVIIGGLDFLRTAPRNLLLESTEKLYLGGHLFILEKFIYKDLKMRVTSLGGWWG